MKKIFIISLLLIFSFGLYAEARVKYDSTGRKIIEDNTIRGRKRAAQAQAEMDRKMRAAAAAKLNYEEALKSLEKPKSNFYQDMVERDYNYNY